MMYRGDGKEKIAKRLGVSVATLEQYFQLKRAELEEDLPPKEQRRPPAKPLRRKDVPIGL